MAPYRYTLTIVRVVGPQGQPLPEPPPIVDLLEEGRPGYPPREWYNVWWGRPEDVPMPVTWPATPIKDPVGQQFQLFYRVARVPVKRNLLDCLPPESKVRIRLGGKGVRMFRNCLASEVLDDFRRMLQGMVADWGVGPTREHHAWDPLWEFLAQDILWIELPSGLRISWADWGDDDEDGGRTLAPMDELPSIEEVTWHGPRPEADNALLHLTRMTEALREFLDACRTAQEQP